jgi:RNA polymerase sigma-32 factor
MSKKKINLSKPKTPKSALTPKVPQVLEAETSHLNDSDELISAEHESDTSSDLEISDRDQDHLDHDLETELENDSDFLDPSATALSAPSIDKELGSLTVQDPLKRYLEEVSHHPLLSTEEEYRLALRLQQKGDADAAKRLIQANLRLVIKIAFEYRNIYSQVMDLIQEGNIGLMKAVSKFDPTKGARLAYYSSWWIRSYILKYLLDNFRLVKIGTTQAQKKLFYQLMKEKNRIESLGQLASPKLLASNLEVKEKEVIEMEHRLSPQGGEVSLNRPVKNDSSDETSPSFLDFLSDPSQSADEQLQHNELLNVLSDHLEDFRKTLNPKELQILNERILSEQPKTLQEIASQHKLTRERARQIESKVISKLKTFLSQYIN